MKNINKNIIINKSNNINNDSKTDRSSSGTPKGKEINSIIFLLKLKKAFLFWGSYTTKKKIIQRLKNIKNFKTPYNTQKTLSIYSLNKSGQGKISSIKTKAINFSNSLINLKKNKNIPQKINMKNNSSRKNIINYNFTKKHSNSVENNNSTINAKPLKSILNSSFNYEKQISLEKHNKKNTFKNSSFNNNVVVVSQYDRKKDIIKKEHMNNNNIIINNNINEEKKTYYFYAIINLIDKHNKRKKIKKCFNIWKSLIRYNRSFINSFVIEEKIISFKSLKQPFKNNNNNTKETKFNKSKLLYEQNNPGLSNCQTEVGCDVQINKEQLNQKYTQNPLEKSVHSNLLKNNNKSKIVYQKKLLIPKKMRNQSMNSIHLNDCEDDNNKNNTINENNKEMNYYSKSPENTFYNMNSHITYNNLNNSDFFNRTNNFDKNIGNIGRIKKRNVTGIEETEVFFNPQVHTVKNSFIFRNKKINEENGFNSNTINVNVIENYRKNNLNQDNINNIFNDNDKNEITIKKIIIKEGNKKIHKNSYCKEIKNAH